MAYAPALSSGSPLAAYQSISASLISCKFYSRDCDSVWTSPFLTRLTPVKTSCQLSLSKRSIRFASSISIGLPAVSLPMTTVVSAPRTISSGCATASAFSVPNGRHTSVRRFVRPLRFVYVGNANCKFDSCRAEQFRAAR